MDSSITVPDPRISAMGRTLLQWMNYRHSRANYKILKKKVLCYPKGWQGCISLFNSNKVTFMMGYTTTAIYFQNHNINNIKWINFINQPHPIKLFTVVCTKQSVANIDNVQNILQFLYTQNIQSKLLQCYSFPVITMTIPEKFKQCIPSKYYLPHIKHSNTLVTNWLKDSM